MMLTPQKIQELAEPIEAVYANIVDELLINIGKHVQSPTWTHTAVWEVQKLSEMGQLTQENAAIINKWIKSIPQEIRDTMEATRVEALEELEKQMEAALKDGYVTPPLADSTVQVLDDLSAQAADRLNLVNTTMLQSSLDQYARAIELTAQEVERAESTQRILNEAAGSAVSGAETRLQAMRRAIIRIADEGLMGFIDRAGRHWTPEAYVNMDIRTTVHNTAIQATRARMSDYGTSVFQVSSHAGARPGCYPYQGKFYSWDNTAGEILLGNGSTVHYEPINSTTYGQPAGLFGINCGHDPIVIIPGFTIPHGADNIQPKAANDKAYAESQQQRALERKIREEKRRVEMLGSTATKKDKERVRQAQAKMREFIARTGRTRRSDREQIVKKALEKQDKDDIIRTNSEGLTHHRVSEEGREIIYKAVFDKITEPVIRKGGNIIIAKPGDENMRYLDSRQATAVTLDDMIILRHDATTTEVLEEVFHFNQNAGGKNNRYNADVRAILNEIEAQEYLISVAEQYKIPQQEREETKQLLEFYKRQRDGMIERGEWFDED